MATKTTPRTDSPSASLPVVTILGGGRLAFGALGMLSPGRKQGRFTVRAWARADEGRKLLADGGADVVENAADSVRDANLVIMAVPAPSLCDVVDACADGTSGDQVVLHASRGVGHDGRLPHQIIRSRSAVKKVAVLGGPLYLDDVREGRHLNAALAARYDEALDLVQSIVAGAPLRITTTHDIIGVELCGVLSNIAHLATGLAAGVGLSETDQGLLTVRALLEASRLGRSAGADRATFSGLAGVGDLIPRRVSSQRRHRDLGAAWGKAGGDVDEATRQQIDQLEGVVSARSLESRFGLTLPLVDALRRILDQDEPALEVLREVLELDLGLTAVGT